MTSYWNCYIHCTYFTLNSQGQQGAGLKYYWIEDNNFNFSLSLLKLALSYDIWLLTPLMVGVILFQIFFANIWEIYYWNIERFIRNAVTWSIFLARKMFFFSNGSEFHQKLNGTIIEVLDRHLRAHLNANMHFSM